MPNIRPVSDLKNYKDVLKDIGVGKPAFLTKDGRGQFAIVDINEYEKDQTTIKVLAKLLEAEKAIAGERWLTEDQMKDLGI